MIAYARALLVDAETLRQAQQENDVVQAQELLQSAYLTDVRPIIAEARMQSGGSLRPLETFRFLKIRDELIKVRGNKTQATGL
jgi:L-rhamnose isomerase/sugar isomerase